MYSSGENALENWIRTLEWDQIIHLQRQITKEIDRRYCNRITLREDSHVKSELERLLREDEKQNNDVLSTPKISLRASPANRLSAIHKNEATATPDTLDLRNEGDLRSSPLTLNHDIILDSQASDILRQNDVNIITNSRNKGSSKKRRNSPLKNFTFVPSQKKSKTIIDFNRNPITGKPWIFEDFKVNELELSEGKKTTASRKLAKFYAKVGSPIKNNQRLILNNRTLEYKQNDTVEDERSTRKQIRGNSLDEDSFDNLNVRSKSPPGFGRLNFPSTQERLADKKECRRMLFDKTKERFLEATDNNLPICERRFYFKNAKLNDIVDDGNFEWNHEKLQIFTR